VPTRLLLEGPDITDLLARVRAQHGESATIVKADKVRVGGVGGFFAKQRYEVIVELDDLGTAVPARSPEPSSGPPPVSRPEPISEPVAALSPVDALLAEFTAKTETLRASTPEPALQFPPRSAPLPPTPAPPLRTADGVSSTMANLSRYIDVTGLGDADGLSPLTAEADTADVVEVTPAIAAAPATAWPSAWNAPVGGDLAPHNMSTESGDFAAVLAQLTHDLQDAEAAIGGEEPAMAEPVVDAVQPEPAPEPVAFRPLYSVPSVGNPVSAPSMPGRADAVGQAALARVLAVDPDPVVEPDPIVVSSPVAVAVAEVVAVADVANTTSAYDKLLGVGLTADLADGVDLASTDLHGELLRVFGDLPLAPALPRRAGDVIVVVGELNAGLTVGRQLAKKMRIDAGALLLAAASTTGTGLPAAQRVTGPADALRRSRRMHRADTPHIVVIDTSLDGESAEWARDIADAFGATAVWAVVDATRKTADVADHLRHLGPVDALVVQHAASTRDPGSVLELGVPVALIDGRTSTPRAWAELVCERLDRGSVR
jgi:hypothetical protein